MMEVKDFNEIIEKYHPVTNYFIDSAFTPPDLRFRDVSNQMIADFCSMKLFGTSVHQRFGGAGFFKSELNWVTESEANDIKSFLVLNSHRLAVEAISDHGDFTHHNEYLMDMAKGQTIGAVCLHAPLIKFDSKAVNVTQNSNGDFVLNGSKSFVTCSQHANILIVVARKSASLRDEFEDEDDDNYLDSYMTFIVDRNASGITVTDEAKTIGCNDVPLVTVNFSNVHLTKGQILSETFDDRKISDKLIASSRLQLATLNMIQAKNLLTQLLQYAIGTESNSEKLRDINYVKEKLAKIGCDLYGLESMIYLTTGIIDQFDNPKVNMECAITKAYSQDILREITEFAMDLIGSPVTISNHPFGVNIRNVLQLQINETSSVLKRYAGHLGIQHAMDHFGHRVSDYKDSSLLRFGLGNPTVEYIETKLDLGDYLHPTLKELSNALERSILRLRFSSEILIKRFEQSISEQQDEIQNLGEAAMRNFAMFASIARASRSYCIGLRYSVYETVAAGCLIQSGEPKILKMALDIKHNRSGYSNLHKAITETTLKRHRNQSISIP